MAIQKSNRLEPSRSKLRPSWRTVRFEEMAEHITDKVDKPSESGVERYVGLEHLDPESLKIRRWGAPTDVEATKLRFKPGDIIFGRRRAYQRKLAVADFEGICCAHALVLRAREDVMLKEFLPLFMQSEVFFERALSISVGSLSPTINWKTLAAQEFAIPPKEEQSRIAETLWAADEACTRFRDAIVHVETLKRLMLERLTKWGPDNAEVKSTALGEIPSRWRAVTVGDLLTLCQYGLTCLGKASGLYPILRMQNIEDGIVSESNVQYVDLPQSDFETYRVLPADILFNRTNSADLVGKVGIYRLTGNHVFASYLIRLRVNSEIASAEYLNYYLNSPTGRKRILAYATPGVSQTNINASNLKKVLVPLPPPEEQTRIVRVLREIDSSREMLRAQVSRLQGLKDILMLRLLSGQNEGDNNVQRIQQR